LPVQLSATVTNCKNYTLSAGCLHYSVPAFSSQDLRPEVLT